MELSNMLKQRFVKNYNLPIKIFSEPYFKSRIRLYDTHFGTLEKLGEFIKDVRKYDNEQDYFENDNKVLQTVVDYIRVKQEYEQFNNMDMQLYNVSSNFSQKDIWNENNIGKIVFSIDLKKANFQALKHYSPNIFDGKETWEEFIGQFTEDQSRINSKHFRSVLFGMLNPKRTVNYEKFLMQKILDELFVTDLNWSKHILSFSNDEIVINVSSFIDEDGEVDFFSLLHIRDELREICKKLNLICHIDCFEVEKIGKDMYKKDFVLSTDSTDVFKKVNHLMMPFVLRKELNEECIAEDYVFFNEGNLCKFLENPLEA